MTAAGSGSACAGALFTADTSGVLPPVVAARNDSARAWIPRDPRELDAPDRLDERDPGPGVGVRADCRDGRWRARRFWAEGAIPKLGRLRAEVMPRDEGGGWGAAGLGARDRTAAWAGAVVIRGSPALLGEALGLAQPLRAPRSPALAAPQFEGPRSTASRVTRGGAARFRWGNATAWGIAGRGSEAHSMAAGGFTAARGPIAAALAAGEVRGDRRAISAAFAWGRVAPAAPGREALRLAGEAMVSRERGPELLAELTRASGPLALQARWRRRSGETRPVAADLAIRGDAGSLAARLTWRPWSARAAGDDGRVELETTWRDTARGTTRLRLGARASELDPTVGSTGSAGGPGDWGERYAIAEIGIARERGRSLTLLASARTTRRATGAVTGTALGGRLTLSARGRAGAVLLLQARRAGVRDGSSAPGAWTAALAPSGAETLASRSGSGLVASGRAWVRWGGFRLEALVSDAAASETEQPSAGSLRIEWGRGDP